jgi:hypothetical protein
MAGPFERDFGYLMPFLDKVEQAAADLADTRAREELVRLMREERVRWTRIRELLGGAQEWAREEAPTADALRASAAPPEPAVQARRAPAPQRAPAGPQAVLPGFTVGSLRVRGNRSG